MESIGLQCIMDPGPWRCPTCGGKINTDECVVCELTRTRSTPWPAEVRFIETTPQYMNEGEMKRYHELRTSKEVAKQQEFIHLSEVEFARQLGWETDDESDFT